MKIRTCIAKEISDKRFLAVIQGAEKHVIHIFDPKIWNVYIGEKICHLSSWCEDLHILQSEDTTIMPILLLRNSWVQDIKLFEINSFVHHRIDILIPKPNEIMNLVV